ncbi:MAG: TolC family protein [Candidatus Omnitrophica bacterium]|nr:TolC family protein [Candidatus Omnitrophota bacterium]MBU1996828.1 TolC family protein [Candidatus Omnitrophota bacterium]MBU4334090.1 TolC family protein [Candidatus Omnitrophota bacterium]
MFLQKLKISFMLFALISMQIGFSYADVGISERRKQLIDEESLVRENEKSEIVSIDKTATLDDYIRIGLKNNPGLRSEFYKWKSSFKKISKESSLSDPQFTFTDYIEEVETRVGPQERAFSINQKLPLPDKLWIRKSKAFKSSEEAYHNFQKNQLDLIYKITDVYYEYAYLSKAILLMEENIKLLKNFESVAQARYKSALAQNQDLLKVQVELGRLENDLYSLKDLQVPLTARLNTLLNLPKNNILPWPNESLEDAVMQDSYNEIDGLYDVLEEKNPDILASSSKIEENKDALKLAKREYFPDLTVGVTQIDTGDALNSSTVDSGKDPLMVTFSVNVPIWFNRLNAGVQDAKASLKASENYLENKENELFSQLVLVHYKLRDALRQSQLYKDALLPKAAQTLNATQSGYEGGKVEFLSLIDAQRVLFNFQLAYYRHNANFHQRLSELQSLLGEIYREN